MKPYFQKENVRLYHADCREFIGKVKYDLLVTDPPYGIGYFSRIKHKFKEHGLIAGDEAWPVEVVNAAIERARCAAYVFLRWDKLGELPRPDSLLVWVKNVPSCVVGGRVGWQADGKMRKQIDNKHMTQWEAIAFYAGPKHHFRKYISDVLRFSKTGNVEHPTEKPVALMNRLIACNDGEVVFDPYAGSGSTLLAALECGRKAIGFEIDEKHCETAAKRLERGVWRNII